MNTLKVNPVHNTASTLQLIQTWAQLGWLRALDVAFAEFLAQQAPDAPPLLLLGAALTSHQLGRGHPCLDLAQTLADPNFALSLPPEGKADATPAQSPSTVLPAEVLAPIKLAQWLESLQHPTTVAFHESHIGNTPLVLAHERLYLRRYWQYEQWVKTAINQRLQTQLPLLPERLQPTLDALFPAATNISKPEPDWQKMACALAARSAFAIITGGPGTGKTTTVVNLLAVLQAMAIGSNNSRPLRIHLAAPTGKAAARLNASIASKVQQLPLHLLAPDESTQKAIRAAIPVEVTTLHRLLGAQVHTRRFKYHAGNPLFTDVLVVDEASMIDLEMMAAVISALPAQARLILLGDKNQLSSVQAGAVLGQLCLRAEAAHYNPDTAAWLTNLGVPLPEFTLDAKGTALDQSIVMLRISHRFDQDSGIGQLAQAVNAGHSAQVRSILALHSCAQIQHLIITAQTMHALQAMILASSGADAFHRVGYAHYLQVLQQTRPHSDTSAQAMDTWARLVLQAHGQFQLLCAVRKGPWGVEGLNSCIAQWLLKHQLIRASSGWYEGRPVLVTQNNAELGLMNGDIGITLEYTMPNGQKGLRVAFAAAKGIQWVQPSRLNAVETVYALTVHKSQGSEFAHTAMIIPDQLSPVLTRELIYTGITRAQKWFTLVETGAPAVLDTGVQRQTLRMGGLMSA